MDHHRLHHHHLHHHHHQQHHNPEIRDSRYYPVPHPPPPPFLDNPNLFPPPPPHRHLPPPPPPPQQHSLSHHHHLDHRHDHHLPYRPPPIPRILHHPPPSPPPPPSPHQPKQQHHHQHVDELNFVNSPHHHHQLRSSSDFSASPRVYDYHRHPRDFNDDHPHRFRFPDPLCDGGLDLDRHQNVNSERFSPPLVETDRFRRGLESPSRVREGLRDDHRRVFDNIERCRLERNHHDAYHPELLLREFKLNPKPMVDKIAVRNWGKDVMMNENVNVIDRHGSQGHVSRSPIKYWNRGVDVNDRFREFRGEGMNCGAEMGIYADRVTREDAQDYSHTPRKNLQKKSAFLRIQPGKPSSFRSRYDTTPSPHKGKRSLEYLDHRSSEESEGSPVELDVSFKSNALVAKAIVAAPSSSVVNPQENSSVSASDNRIDGENCSKEEHVKTYGSNSSISRRESKHSEKRVRVSPIMKRDGIPSNMEVNGSKSESSPSGSSSFSGGSKGSLKNETSDKDDTHAHSDKVSSPNVRKKRKLITPLSRLSNAVPTKTDIGHVDVDRSINHPSLDSVSNKCIKQSWEDLSSDGKVTESTQYEITLVTGKLDVNESTIMALEQEVVGHSISEASFPERMMKMDRLETVPDSVGLVGAKVSEGPGNSIDCVQDVQHLLSSNADATNSIQKSSLDIGTQDSFSKGQDIVPMLIDDGSVEGSSEPVMLVDDVHKPDIYCGNVDACNSMAGMISMASSVAVAVKKENRMDLTGTPTDINNPFVAQATLSPESDMTGQSYGDVHLSGKSSPGQLGNSDGHANLGNLSNIDESSDKTSNAFGHDDFISIDCENLTTAFDIRATNKIPEQQCRGARTALVSDEAREGFPKARVSMTAGGDLTGNALVERRVEGVAFLSHSCDLDPLEYPSNCSKTRKILPLESVVCDASISENCDRSTSADCLISMSMVPLDSVEYSTRPVGEIVPSNSVLPDRNAAGVVNNSLHKPIYSFADSSKADYLSRDSCLFVKKITSPDYKQSTLFPESSCKQKENGNLNIGGTIHGSGSVALKSEDIMTSYQSGDVPCGNADHAGDLDCGPVVTDSEFENNTAAYGSLPSLSDFPQLCAESTYCRVTTNSDMDTHSNVGSRGACSILIPTEDMSNVVQAVSVLSDEKMVVGQEKSSEPLATPGSLSSRSISLRERTDMTLTPSISAAPDGRSFAQETVQVPSKNAKNTVLCPKATSRHLIRRNVLTRADASSSSSHASVSTSPKKIISTYPAKPRTWNRANNLPASNVPQKKPFIDTAPPQRPPLGKTIKVQGTSYIRKGNSLVRNPSSVAATSCSCVFDESIKQSKPNDTNRNKMTASPGTTDSAVTPDIPMAAGQNTAIEMPKTPPLPCSAKGLNCNSVYSGDCRSSALVDQLKGKDNEEALKSSEMALSSFINQDNTVDRSLEDTCSLSDGIFLAQNANKVVYIKRKSNQLVAASSTSEPSRNNVDRTPAYSSDSSYYKRRKNQLIRASSESNIQKMVAVIDDNFGSQPRRALKVHSGINSTKRHYNKVKSSKVSLVWKPGQTKFSGRIVKPLRCGKILPHLLPWKRATYWRSFWQSTPISSCGSSLTKIRKLLTSRNRAAVYVRSGRGFSLRRSKVISLGGSSLKWSKSMERRSKKVNEEAAAATYSAEREKTGTFDVISGAESRKNSSLKSVYSMKLQGERIFRIGVFRYRMDPSRQTLQRISDEEPSGSAASKPEKETIKPYVPKRLLIGNDEYIRIGNGNQLVRDPKRRTRILASEKVRWSLHTARMRLAKKRKFCQFFTRFGKCNKGEGKCPFLHDPSKIAVCTKFLNGLCADPNCKLTHKVIPERMPDCSFFLQGLCSNQNCPYRHVNVNPQASVCENFLRGYCAEGNECRKKHSYICPEFEASGSCKQGSKCKLYHPRKGKVKKTKTKTSKDERNSRGRYFGSGLTTVAEPETTMVASKYNHVVFEGGLGDFISLDDASDDDEAVENENDDLISEPSTLLEGDPLSSQLDDLDELIIKPIRLLDRKLS